MDDAASEGLGGWPAADLRRMRSSMSLELQVADWHLKYSSRTSLQLSDVPASILSPRAARRKQPSTVVWMVATERSTFVLSTLGIACLSADLTR